MSYGTNHVFLMTFWGPTCHRRGCSRPSFKVHGNRGRKEDTRRVILSNLELQRKKIKKTITDHEDTMAEPKEKEKDIGQMRNEIVKEAHVGTPRS
ncbi:hypothetical protein DY000_02040220 [Brassica cretica]|uniref:Uncharacterized protein n=1 Tax=Brassica cretica TaxID=69181 RepID=A0ABQ7B527_BRACR|nr:hypothetical protein DY000_02040220 [Brassica cretica]